MPSLFRQVDFDLKPDYSRLPHDDEEYVIKAFARHAAHCSSCAHPYEVYKRGGMLCAKGHQRALDVALYLYSKGDRAFSRVDRDANIRTQVEIPAGCEAVRGLLKAMDQGLRLRRRGPEISYDQTYYVPPRRVRTEIVRESDRPRSILKPRVETIEPYRPAESKRHRRDKTGPVGRGSLFADDIREREERLARQPVYWEVSPRTAPLPADDWY